MVERSHSVQNSIQKFYLFFVVNGDLIKLDKECWNMLLFI